MNVKKCISLLLLISELIILQATGYTYISGIFLFLSIIIINLVLIVRSYKNNNSPLLLFFLYTFAYVYVLRYPFIDGIQVSVYYYFNDLDHMYKTGLLFFLFFGIISVFIDIPYNPSKQLILYKNNFILFYLFLLVAIIFMIFGKSGETIFSSGSYGLSEKSSSSLNEYFFIPFFIAIIFSNNSKEKVFLLYAIACIYALKNLLFGGRIEVVMIALCIFIWKLNCRVKPRTVILLSVFAFYFFAIIGNIRENPLVLFSANWSDFLLPTPTSDTLVIRSQEGDVLYATNRLVAMVDEDIINLFDRIKGFLFFILSIIIPYSYLPDIANLASYNKDIYNVGGGGLPFGMFYVYFSYLGVAFIAYYISSVLSNIGKEKIHKQTFYNIYCVFVFFTMPRWFAYSPIIIFKLSLYGGLITLIVLSFDTWIKNIIHKRKLL